MRMGQLSDEAVKQIHDSTFRKQRSKDVLFMQSAMVVAGRSKCSSRQIGVVLVKDGSVVSEGYNGAPRGSSLCQDRSQPCRRRQLGFGSGEGLDQCPAVHAEMNALLQAARNGIATKGTTMYAYCCRPCKWCVSMMINAGITRLVHLELPVYDELSGHLLAESGIEVVTLTEAEVSL